MGIDTALFKKNLKEFYDQEAELRNAERYRPDWKVRIRADFCDLVKRENKKSLLELGSGPGFDSTFFMDKGLNVTAVDLSSEMVKKCREKGIEAYELDFYNLHAIKRKFDCVWALNSLLHVPKIDLPHVLNEISSVLEKNGLFYMGVYGGEDFEKDFVISEVSDNPRFFSYYSKDSLKETLEKHFEIISFEQFEAARFERIDIFQSVIMRKIDFFGNRAS